MTITDLVNQYANKEIDAIEFIRIITGVINPNHAVDILAIINQITRVEQGDLDLETLKRMYKI